MILVVTASAAKADVLKVFCKPIESDAMLIEMHNSFFDTDSETEITKIMSEHGVTRDMAQDVHESIAKHYYNYINTELEVDKDLEEPFSVLYRGCYWGSKTEWRPASVTITEHRCRLTSTIKIDRSDLSYTIDLIDNTNPRSIIGGHASGDCQIERVPDPKF